MGTISQVDVIFFFVLVFASFFIKNVLLYIGNASYCYYMIGLAESEWVITVFTVFIAIYALLSVGWFLSGAWRNVLR